MQRGIIPNEQAKMKCTRHRIRNSKIEKKYANNGLTPPTIFAEELCIFLKLIFFSENQNVCSENQNQNVRLHPIQTFDEYSTTNLKP